jgi:spore coat protein U domain-containing protein, fimbrial subunit CupE1/2/3/6
MMKITQCLLLLVVCAVFSLRASATAVCSVSSTGTAFGSYDTVSATTKDTVGTISVTCSGSVGDAVNYSIALSPGDGALASRTMEATSTNLNYNLFIDGAHTVIWGDGTSGTATVSDNYTLTAASITRQYFVYGEIPGQNGPTAATYMDTLVITVTY